ncbi:hypothetical protein FIBSPDRAFT_875410 [Athelia psychrophila]|uniref:Uncharacterized protein n=1 Tax=Athelia psychrophila TaxID=1759441 RepID=A0A167XSL2_9AGAM|nr:hypothetical protein FIBSPDRAFT_875410 [Fibularhizoctonia sp. CBS 109695]
MILRSVQVSTLGDRSCWLGTCDVERVGGCEFRIPRAASCAPRPPPAPAPTHRTASASVATPAPTHTRRSLLNLHPEGIKALSVGTLTAIIFQNHFNARLAPVARPRTRREGRGPPRCISPDSCSA